MKTEDKIDRPIVRMTRTRDDGGYDFTWYKTMMGKQSQIINIIKDTNNTLERIHKMDQERISLLKASRDDLQKRFDKLESKYNNRVSIFRPWKLFKKRNKNVGN